MADQLTRGITPQKIAFTLTLGFAIGIFPILGSTTLLCFFAGSMFQLNQPLLQTLNYALYPLNILLIPAFIRAGEKIFGADPVPFNLGVWLESLRNSPSAFLHEFGMAGVHAVAAWCLIVPVPAFIVYRLLNRAVLKFADRRGTP